MTTSTGRSKRNDKNRSRAVFSVSICSGFLSGLRATMTLGMVSAEAALARRSAARMALKMRLGFMSAGD